MQRRGRGWGRPLGFHWLVQLQLSVRRQSFGTVQRGSCSSARLSHADVSRVSSCQRQPMHGRPAVVARREPAQDISEGLNRLAVLVCPLAWRVARTTANRSRQLRIGLELLLEFPTERMADSHAAKESSALLRARLPPSRPWAQADLEAIREEVLTYLGALGLRFESRPCPIHGSSCEEVFASERRQPR